MLQNRSGGSDVALGPARSSGRVEALPLRAQSVDLITAAGSLNYADLDRFFADAARVLRPAGILAIYDFSEGRSFRKSSTLDAWYTEFLRRYPMPSGSGQAISPESLKALDCGFEIRAAERFEIGLILSRSFYVDYVLSETNVAAAVQSGAVEEHIERWCAATLDPVFGGREREVLFRGYFVCMIEL